MTLCYNYIVNRVVKSKLFNCSLIQSFNGKTPHLSMHVNANFISLEIYEDSYMYIMIYTYHIY